MSPWTFFGWCLAIGIGLPIALLGLFMIVMVTALALDSAWEETKLRWRRWRRVKTTPGAGEDPR